MFCALNGATRTHPPGEEPAQPGDEVALADIAGRAAHHEPAPEATARPGARPDPRPRSCPRPASGAEALRPASSGTAIRTWSGSPNEAQSRTTTPSGASPSRNPGRVRDAAGSWRPTETAPRGCAAMRPAPPAAGRSRRPRLRARPRPAVPAARRPPGRSPPDRGWRSPIRSMSVWPAGPGGARTNPSRRPGTPTASSTNRARPPPCRLDRWVQPAGGEGIEGLIPHPGHSPLARPAARRVVGVAPPAGGVGASSGRCRRYSENPAPRPPRTAARRRRGAIASDPPLVNSTRSASTSRAPPPRARRLARVGVPPDGVEVAAHHGRGVGRRGLRLADRSRTAAGSRPRAAATLAPSPPWLDAGGTADACHSGAPSAPRLSATPGHPSAPRMSAARSAPRPRRPQPPTAHARSPAGAGTMKAEATSTAARATRRPGTGPPPGRCHRARPAIPQARAQLDPVAVAVQAAPDGARGPRRTPPRRPPAFGDG